MKLLREIRLEEARSTEKAMVTKALDALEHSLSRWDYPCEKSEKQKTIEALKQVGDGEGVPWSEIRHKYIDEDTAGDDAYGDRVRSEAEKRDTCDNGRCNGGPSPAASETVPNADDDNSEESPNRVGGLEPVGRVEGETFETECSRGVVKFGADDGLEEQPEGTPLFTADQIIELVDAAWQDVNRDLRENDEYGDETFVKQAIIGSDLATAEIKHRLEDFTQGESGE